MKISQEVEKLFDEWAREAAKREKDVQVLPLKKKIVEYLQERFPGDETVEFNGQIYKVREFVKTITDYAKLFQHTARMKACTMNVLRMCREHNNDLVVVSNHDNPCDICAKYEKKVFSISGKHPIYPAVTLLPPFHTGCRHNINPTSDIAIAAREEWENLEREGKRFDGLNPDDNWGSIDGKPYTVREWAELLATKYGDAAASAWLDSLKGGKS